MGSSAFTTIYSAKWQTVYLILFRRPQTSSVRAQLSFGWTRPDRGMGRSPEALNRVQGARLAPTVALGGANAPCPACEPGA